MRASRLNANLLVAAIIAALIGLIPVVSSAATVLVTGANSGLGLEFSKQYAEAGWTVIATHRRSEVPDTLAALRARYGNVRIETMDVTNPEQVQALASKLQNVPIDVLLNNAGVYNDRSTCNTEDCPGDWRTQDFGSLRYALFDTIMAVNVKGPLLVSEAFAEHVKASEQKKIVSISSSNGSLTEPLGGSGAIFYRASKAALNRAMQLVALAEEPNGVTVLLFNPGPVLTERQAYLRGQFEGMIEMPITVSGMIEQIATLTLEDTGRFIQYDGATMPW